MLGFISSIYLSIVVPADRMQAELCSESDTIIIIKNAVLGDLYGTKIPNTMQENQCSAKEHLFCE